MTNRAEKLFLDFKTKGWQTPNLYQRLFELTDDSVEIYYFCKHFLTNIEKGATIFDDSLSYIQEEQFSELIELSLSILKQKKNENAEEVIEYASLQFPRLLHPHLDLIFELKPSERAFYAEYPWRNLPSDMIFSFKQKLQNPETSLSDKKKLFNCLLETRDFPTIKFAYQYAWEIDLVKKDILIYYLEAVGFTIKNGAITSYCPNRTYHFSFPKNYFLDDKAIYLNKEQHPTWRLKPTTQKYKFGGLIEEDGNNPFMHILTLDPIPPGIQITGIDRLTLGVHIRELNEFGSVFYKHDNLGYPQKIGEVRQVEIYDDSPIKETEVLFSETPQRWELQCWGSSNSRENLFRLGGEPTWIQSAEVLTCPICNEKMDFLMQLDADLPDMNGNELYFGSGGICYIFWCSKSNVSGFLIQCT